MLQALPVYRSMKELRSYLFNALDKMPKKYRYPLMHKVVEDIFNCVRLLAMLANARKKEDKIRIIDNLLTEIDLVIDAIEFLVEEKAFTTKQSSVLVLKIDDIGSQLGAFKKFLSEECNQNPISKE